MNTRGFLTQMLLPLASGLLIALGAAAGSANELVAYEVEDEISIPQSLTGAAGDPVNGRKVAINRKQGNCLACHILPADEQPFHGETGPSLIGVADRYTEGELRLRMVDAKAINPASMMPSFYETKHQNRVMEKFKGKPILTAEQVEDVLAYLMTLKEQ